MGYRFLLEHKGKTYKESDLVGYNTFYINKLGTVVDKVSLKSLYIEDPDEIDIILEAYEYTTAFKKYYKLDLDNLPQTLEYDGSEVTVESVEYGENDTIINIKEDTDEDRKYLKSNIYTKVFLEGEEDDSWISYKYSDPTGPYNPREKVENQQIIMSLDAIHTTPITESNRANVLKPDQIYIQGQSYIEYPNEKINLKLK